MAFRVDAQARVRHAAATPGLPRTSSGLQSMQSVEQALGNVEQDIMDRVAEDWVSNQQRAVAPKLETRQGR